MKAQSLILIALWKFRSQFLLLKARIQQIKPLIAFWVFSSFKKDISFFSSVDINSSICSRLKEEGWIYAVVLYYFEVLQKVKSCSEFDFIIIILLSNILKYTLDFKNTALLQSNEKLFSNLDAVHNLSFKDYIYKLHFQDIPKQ